MSVETMMQPWHVHAVLDGLLAALSVLLLAAGLGLLVWAAWRWTR